MELEQSSLYVWALGQIVLRGLSCQELALGPFISAASLSVIASVKLLS